MVVYHGGYCEIINPEIRISLHKKDFGHGFYCTEFQEQAEKWAKRYNKPIVSTYKYTLSDAFDILKFDAMTEEWLDFIVDCRSGKPHKHAIVKGPMANDQVWNYIADFVSGVLSREQFWILAKYKYPTHQLAFCSRESLHCLDYLMSYEVTK